MKKYTCLVFLFLFSVKSYAQGAFCATVQAGPSLTFSNFDFSPGYSGFFSDKATARKIVPAFGAGFGYRFPNQIIHVETGLYRTFPHVLLDLDEWEQPTPRGADNRVYLWYNTWQVPVRLKLRIWQPSDRISLRVVTGAVFTFTQSYVKMKGDVINVGYTGKQTIQGDFTFQTNASAALARTYTVQLQKSWGILNNAMVETGLEATYKIANNLEGLVSLIFQNGLHAKLGADIYATQPDPTTGQPVTWLASGNTTDGNALNLHVGLAYTFGE